jgi:hypothetical protein
MLDEPGLRRDKDSQIALNTVLARQDGLALRLDDYFALTTGPLLAADGIENDTSQPSRLHKVCALVDRYIFAVRLTGYLIMFHFVGRREVAARPPRPCRDSGLPAYLMANLPLLMPLLTAYFPPASGFCHTFLRQTIIKVIKISSVY